MQNYEIFKQTKNNISNKSFRALAVNSLTLQIKNATNLLSFFTYKRRPKSNKQLFFLLLFSILPIISLGQKKTTEQAKDTTSNQNTAKTSASKINARVDYQARDSILLFENGTGFLYGKASVDYQLKSPVQLEAEIIRMVMDSSLVYAEGIVDSVGDQIGFPIFREGADEYRARSLKYNFNSRKGYIRRGITQQGDGYIVADESKKGADDMLFMRNGKYTTCDNHDHPHFYIQLTKAKVKPQHYVAAGPAYLVIEDVPLPIAVPFGFFPFTKSYSSGIIMPSYGDDFTRGFYLKNGGYYFALSDYFDLELTGDIYTKGTWALYARSTYKKRYKFRGSINMSYRNDVTGIKGLPDYSQSRNFRMSWTHSQDSKASLYSTFSASVDFATSGYTHSNINHYYNANELAKNTTSSSISYTQRFPESPWSISVTAMLTQRTKDSVINLNLPNMTFSMSRIYPFKKKNRVGKERWYEKIYMSYTGTFSNSIETKENLLFKTKFSKWRNGFKHQLPIGASFNIFKYISISPTFNFNYKWYFSREERSWDEKNQKEIIDTTAGFYNVYDFSLGVSMQTKIYGFYTPIRKIFGDKVDRIRHIITPSISFNYHPDFSDPLFKFYKTYTQTIIDKNNINRIQTKDVMYSPYANSLYGVAGKGTSGSLGFSLANNLEMKVKDTSDSTKTNAYKKISLIDNFSISGSYNFAADSMKLGNFSTNLRLKITKKFSINLSGAFDPYKYALNDNGNPVHINQLRKFPRFLGTGTSFQYTFNNDTFKRKDKKEDEDNVADQIDDGSEDFDNEENNADFKNDKKKKDAEEEDDDGYQKVNIPWSLSVNYSIRWGQSNIFNKEKMEYDRKFTHNLSISGSISPTPQWHVSYSLSYDFNAMKVTSTNISINRDLHCWVLSASMSPFGLYKSYTVTVGVKSSMLRDLKYEKRSDNSDNYRKWF